MDDFARSSTLFSVPSGGGGLGFGTSGDGEAMGFLALSGELLCDQVVMVQ